MAWSLLIYNLNIEPGNSSNKNVPFIAKKKFYSLTIFLPTPTFTIFNLKIIIKIRPRIKPTEMWI